MTFNRLTLTILFLISATTSADPLKVAFIYPSGVGEAGWSFSHDQGRVYLEQQFNNLIETSFLDQVPTGHDAKDSIQGYANEGFDLIFTASKDFAVPTSQLAKVYPKIQFVNIGGYRVSDNLSEVQIRGYQGRYLTGLIAGGMTKSNVIGFVAAFPVPEVIRGINAFTLGVREANPKAVVRVKWSHSWFDPATERSIATELINDGADVLTSQVDSTTTLEVAEERGVYTFGYYSDMSKYAPKHHLTSVIYNWGKVFEGYVGDLLSRESTPHSHWQGLEEGAVELSSYHQAIPAGLVDLVESRKADIKSGKYKVFQGPVHNQRGWTVVKENVTPSDEDLLSMTWYVEGIDGRMPVL